MFGASFGPIGEGFNFAAVSHVNKDRLDRVSDTSVASEFAGRTATRLAAFGRYGQE